MRTFTLVVLILLLIAGRTWAQEVNKEGFYSEPSLVLDPKMHTGAVFRLDADAAGRFIVTGSYDKSVRVWSADDGRLLRTIRVPIGPGRIGEVFAVAISPDGSKIAIGGQFGVDPDVSLLLFERATGHQIGRIGSLPSPVNALAFSPDGRKIAATLGVSQSRSWGLRLYDAGTLMQIAAQDYVEPSYGIAFDRAGRIATTSYDGNLRLYGPALETRVVVRAPGGIHPFGVAFSPDGGRIAVGYDDTSRVDVLDAETLTMILTPDMRGANLYATAVTWSPDGNILYAGGRMPTSDRQAVLAWDIKKGSALQIFPVAKNTVHALRTLNDGRVAIASAEPNVLLLNPTGSLVWRVEAPTIDFRDDALKVNRDGTRIFFGFERNGKSQAVFDLRQRSLDVDPKGDPELIASRVEGLPVSGWKNTEEPKLAGHPLTIDRAEISRSLAIAPDARSFVLGSEWALRRFDATGALMWHTATGSIVWAVNVTADGRLVVAAEEDGTVRWYRMDNGVELLALYPHPDGKRWVVWTHLGYYAASPGAEEFIEWQANRGLDEEPVVYSASRFRDRFYRPDVMEKILDTLDPKQALEAADKAAGQQTVSKSITEDAPPRVAILDPADGTFAGTPELSVAYTIEDRPDTEIRRVRLLLDGRGAAEQRDLKIPADGRLKGELKITLQGQSSLLTLLAESERGSSDPASVQIRRNTTDESYKPVLYVLAVGVDRFQNAPNLKLSFADADATAFVEHLRQQQGGLYSRVEVRTLLNQEATGEAVLDGLEWLEREMTSRDVAMVFFSTHGANDAVRDFFLLPYDVDIQDEIRLRRTAVRYSDVRATLVRLADRGKTLVFLDACHAGNVVPGTKAEPADIDKVAADLASAENGVIVFSSSTAKQLSLESEAFHHGVFTEAILEAFEGRSNAPPPWLHVSDLDVWLKERVKILTNGAQSPRVSIPTERFTNPRVFMIVHPAPG